MDPNRVIHIVATCVERSKEEVITEGEKSKDVKLNPIQKEILFLYTASLTLDQIIDDYEIELKNKYIVKFYDRISENLEKMCSYEKLRIIRKLLIKNEIKELLNLAKTGYTN